ncbi:hypothetical protein SAMN06295912_108135 [Sphingomonas laterariae]|uniref:ASCH domain-containing protein n=2 Tax=Edaphosphingomonas laterariae TaxID=861865 RepID=A0A239FBB8_9SPHN|nr:hypothetical protein SAMN06295912_108135 [Sphingomonas laterariae]
MKALSVRQPWAFSILFGGKEIENRNWSTRYRGPLALHAAKGMTNDEFDAWQLFLSVQGLRGDWLTSKTMADLQRGGVVGMVDLVDCVNAHPSRWFQGPYGFVLANPRPVAFIPCAGKLGFFDLPAHVAQLVELDLTM